MSIPSASFVGASVPRSAAVRLFGTALAPAAAGGFACDQTAALAFSWAGTDATSEAAGGGGGGGPGAPIPLGFSNQVNGKTLLLPPRTVAAGAVARFSLRVCYAANGDQSLCGSAATEFTAVQSPLVRCCSSLVSNPRAAFPPHAAPPGAICIQPRVEGRRAAC